MGGTEYGEAPGDQTGGDPPLNDPRRPAEQSIADEDEITSGVTEPDDDDPDHGGHYLRAWARRHFPEQFPPLPQRRPPLTVVRPGAEPDRLRRYALATLDSCATEVAGTPEGARNDTLNAATYRAARVALAAGLDLAIVRATMEDAGARSGLTGRGVGATVASALDGAEQAGPADLSHVGGETYGDAYSFEPDSLEPDTGDQQAPLFSHGGPFILDVPKTPDALWGDGNDVLWAPGESLMIAGPMGLGKTTVAGLLVRNQLGLGGGTLLGLPVKPRGGKILYLAMDRPQQIARAMARQFTEDDRAVLDDRLLIWQGPPPADVAKRPELLTLLAETADASTLFVDSVKDAAIGLSGTRSARGTTERGRCYCASGWSCASFTTRPSAAPTEGRRRPRPTSTARRGSPTAPARS